MELEKACGSEKHIPPPNFPFLPAALGHRMAAWGWYWEDLFIHSTVSFCTYSVVWPFTPTCLETHLYQACLRAVPGPIIYKPCVLSGPSFPHL